MPVAGIQRLKGNIRASFKGIAEDKTYQGLYAILQQGSALSATLTPIDSSTLVNSLYSPVIKGTSGHVGYTAKYAQWVHEMPGKLRGQPRAHFGRTGNRSAAGPQQMTPFGGGTGKGNYWDPKAVPQFLTVAFDKITPHIPKLLKEAYRV
jgi:hypothetical protein